MFIQIFPSGPVATNAYVAGCSFSKEAIIIDPSPGSACKIISFLSEQAIIPKAILLTHSHWDHIADVLPLKEKYQIPLSVHPLDAPNLQKPGADGLSYRAYVSIPDVEPDSFLNEGDVIEVGELHFQVLYTPGHSHGCICFFEPEHLILFSGDTLFKSGIGNLSFPTSQPSRMGASLRKLALLPPQTKIFPGHGPSTTILAEQAIFDSYASP